MYFPGQAGPPDYASLLKKELLAASPILQGIVSREELGVFVLHESITLATNGDEEQQFMLKDLANSEDAKFCDFATHQYYNPEQNYRVVQCVQLEHARRLLAMTSAQNIRRLAPTIEKLVEGVQTHDFLPFIKRLTALAWKEGFQWQPKNESSYSALFNLYQCMIAATSEDRDRELYRYLISLQGWEASIAMDAIQLVLDFTVHFDDSDSSLHQNRMALLHALHRLASNSGRYPAVVAHKPVERPESYPEPIGEGSFGKVFTVKEEGKALALKVSRKNLGAKTFCKEVITWCNLSHQNVLPFYGVYFDPRKGQFTLVSPFMRLGNVRKYLEEYYPRIAGPRLLLLSDIISGLAYIHRMGVIHGDLKGDNILVSDSGRACLADFGISTVSTDANRQLRVTLPSTAQPGTCPYQAPELFGCTEVTDRLPLSEKSDVYAFGCVCYEIMTMKQPFHGFLPTYIIVAVVDGKRPTKPLPIDVAFTNLGLTDSLWRLMELCWLADPIQRPTAQRIKQHPVLATLCDNRPTNSQLGELTAAQTRQNKVVTSLRAHFNGSSTTSSMYTSCTSYA